MFVLVSIGISVTAEKIHTLSQTILSAERIAFTQTQHLIDSASLCPLPLNGYGVPPLNQIEPFVQVRIPTLMGFERHRLVYTELRLSKMKQGE